jgi:hypothetical protein
MDEESPSILDIDPEALSDVESIISYTNDGDVRDKLRVFFDKACDQDSLVDHSVAVTGFPAKHRDIDSVDDKQIISGKNKTTFYKKQNLLVITMAGTPHDIAGRYIQNEMHFQFKNMNCDQELCFTGGAKRFMLEVNKAPDESIGPRNADYCTFVIETGVAESARKLDRDAKLWLEDPSSHVTQAITMKISPVRKKITIHLWTRVPDEQSLRRHAEIEQEIEVTMEGERIIASNRLRISFQKILERRPINGTSEKDLVISKRELGRMAGQLWQKLGLLELEPHHGH